MTSGHPAPHLLVFEPQSGGHHPAFVRMLAQGLAQKPAAYRVTYAVTEALLARLRREDDFDLEERSGARALSIDAADASACESGGLLRRSLARWRILCSCVERTGASHATAPFFDPLQLPLAAGRRAPRGATLSGVLFRPSLHGIYAGERAPSFPERLRGIRQRLVYSRMLRSPSLAFLLTLDPFFPAFATERFRGGERVRAIGDPAVEPPRAAAGEAIGADLQDALAGDALLFALFGALTERKGVLQVLAAVEQLDPAARRRARVVFAGDPEPALAARLREWRQRSPAAAEACRFVERRLTTGELARLVARADVVLAPYQRFVGSSGVLAWAAAAGKPVLAQDFGLVGALVRRYALGVATDTTDPGLLAQSLAALVQPGAVGALAKRADWPAFLHGRTEYDFGATYRDALDRVLAPGGSR